MPLEHVSVVCVLLSLSTSGWHQRRTNLAKGGEELRQQLLEKLLDCSLVGPYVQLSFNRDPALLPLRELPHGNWSNVYLLYVSWCKAQGTTAASRSTFFSVADRWKRCMRFHKRSQHQMCLTCGRLKTRMRSSKDFWSTWQRFIL